MTLAVFFTASILTCFAANPQSMPQASETSPETQAVDVCARLQNPEHKKLAVSLVGNERVLFCSIFDDVMRDKAVKYTKQAKPLTPQEAVIQVGKDSGLLFNPVPGGACPTG